MPAKSRHAFATLSQSILCFALRVILVTPDFVMKIYGRLLVNIKNLIMVDFEAIPNACLLDWKKY